MVRREVERVRHVVPRPRQLVQQRTSDMHGDSSPHPDLVLKLIDQLLVFGLLGIALTWGALTGFTLADSLRDTYGRGTDLAASLEFLLVSLILATVSVMGLSVCRSRRLALIALATLFPLALAFALTMSDPWILPKLFEARLPA